MKKPAKYNEQFIRTDTRAIRSFNRDGVNRFAERMQRRVPIGIVKVIDRDSHWELKVEMETEKA